jgi:uncharacterized protein (TIGR02996 family)
VSSAEEVTPAAHHSNIMLEDESFLRMLLADPDDRGSKLVYADWLDERDDPRADFLRLEARLAMELGDSERAEIRQPLRVLQSSLPVWWLLLVGGLRATPGEADPARIEVAALALGRRPKSTDGKGYELTIEAAATCPLSGRVAFLESRSKWRGEMHDIRFDLRLRDPAGDATSWEPETYNPYFGCSTRFLEWYGDVVLFIYREKHTTYLARIGFDSRPDYREIADDWLLSGRQIAHIGWSATEVRRLSIPRFEELPPLFIAKARELELLPDTRWEAGT